MGVDEAGLPTLFEWAGGTEAVRRLIDAFYDRVEADDLLSAFFPGGVSEHHRDHVAAWWSEVLGGPPRYTDELGGYIRPQSMSYEWRVLMEKLDLPRIRLHDLRHTHATLALKAGVHPKVVSERLGHATVGITLDLYSHVAPSLAKDAAEQIMMSTYGDDEFGIR